jgi:hypothetical protein
VDAVRAVVAGTNCPACSHPHFLTEPSRERRAENAQAETGNAEEPMAVAMTALRSET